MQITSALTDGFLKRIGELYTIEAEIRGMPAKRRLAERQQKAKPRLKSESWLREKVKTLSRQFRTGESVHVRTTEPVAGAGLLY